jgi:hypothetical protein
MRGKAKRHEAQGTRDEGKGEKARACLPQAGDGVVEFKFDSTTQPSTIEKIGLVEN